jgi:hypothetical protein
MAVVEADRISPKTFTQEEKNGSTARAGRPSDIAGREARNG